MGNQSEVRRNFGRWAANYKHSSVHANHVDLDRMLELLNPSQEAAVLDVATGSGHTAIKLASRVKKVVAIDITPEMLAMAQETAFEQNVSNIEFRLEDVHQLSMPDNQFDIVTSRFAPHHFDDLKGALREMCRVLKPGGKLYILDCSVVDGDEPENELNRVEFLRDSSHVFSYSPRLWKELLAELPLRTEKVELYRDRYELPQWFERMGTSLNKRQEIFWILDNLSQPYKAQYPYSQDYITTYRIEILATKV